MGERVTINASTAPPVELSADARIVLDVGATHIRSAIADGVDLIEATEVRVAATADPDFALDRLIVTVRRLLTTERTLEGRAVGVGIAGAIDRDGVITDATALGFPHGFALGRRLEAALGCPIVLDNDANMAALGEYSFGAAAGTTSMALLSIGTNLGMGIVLDGRVHTGASGAAGEIGTLPVPLPPGTAPRGAGGPSLRIAGLELHWLEDVFGGRAMLGSYARLADREIDPSLRIVTRAHQDDPLAARVLDEALSGWALAIAATVSVVDPGVVVVGGGISADLSRDLPRLAERVRELLPTTPVEIRLAALGAMGGLIGAGVAAARTASDPAPVAAGSDHRDLSSPRTTTATKEHE